MMERATPESNNISLAGLKFYSPSLALALFTTAAYIAGKTQRTAVSKHRQKQFVEVMQASICPYMLLQFY